MPSPSSRDPAAAGQYCFLLGRSSYFSGKSSIPVVMVLMKGMVDLKWIDLKVNNSTEA